MIKEEGKDALQTGTMTLEEVLSAIQVDASSGRLSGFSAASTIEHLLAQLKGNFVLETPIRAFMEPDPENQGVFKCMVVRVETTPIVTET